MTAYVEFEILEGAYEISCPDAMCPTQGILTINEILLLASPNLMDKHLRYRLNRGKSLLLLNNIIDYPNSYILLRTEFITYTLGNL